LLISPLHLCSRWVLLVTSHASSRPVNRLIHLVTNLHSHQHWVLSLANSPNSKTHNRRVHLVQNPLAPLLSSDSVGDPSVEQQTTEPSHPAGDQPPLSPAPCSVTGQQSMQQDLEPLSSTVTFASRIPIPHRERPTTKISPVGD